MLFYNSLLLSRIKDVQAAKFTSKHILKTQIEPKLCIKYILFRQE
jgi:hypothetical protein